MTLACATSCVIPGRHLDDCGAPCECVCHTQGAYPPPCDQGDGDGCHTLHRPTRDDCTGCLPQQAAPGIAVCDSCKLTTVHAITQTPGLVVHIRSHVEPGSAPTGPKIRHTKGDSAPSPATDPATLDLLEHALRPDQGRTTVGAFLDLQSQLAGSHPTAGDDEDGVTVLRDAHYHEHDVIAALIGEVQRLRGEAA